MPAYTGTKAQTGLGTLLSINTGSTQTPNYASIGEVTTSKQSGRTAQTADVTNLQSPAAEFITTLIDSGTWDLTGNRVVGDPGQVALESAFAGLVPTLFQVELPKTGAQTGGDTYSFTAVVSEFDPTADISTKNAITFSAKLKVSGLITFAAGATS